MKYQSKRNGKVYVVVDEFQKGGKTVNLTLEAEDGTQTVVTTSTLKKNYTPVEEASDVAPAQEKAPEKPVEKAESKKEKKAEKQTSKKSEKPAKEKKEREVKVDPNREKFIDDFRKAAEKQNLTVLTYEKIPALMVFKKDGKTVLEMRWGKKSYMLNTKRDVCEIDGAYEQNNYYLPYTVKRIEYTDTLAFEVLDILKEYEVKKAKSTKKEKGEN